MGSEQYQIGNLILNAGTQEVTREGELVPLPPLSFALLLTLARHAPNLVTTKELEEEVWAGLVIDRGTINKRVVLVRNALRKAGCEREYISVVRGTGYRLAVPVGPIEKAGAEESALADTAPVIPASNTRPASAMRWAPWAIMALMVVAVLAWNWPGVRQTEAPVERNGSLEGVRAFSGASSIAVLPFENASGTTSDNYFAEGIAREIVRMLDGFEGLDVASSSSSFEFRDPEVPSSEVGDLLGVETLLAGTVHREAGRLIIMTRLLEASTGRVIWADRYDHPMEDVFQVQGHIAGEVASALMVNPGGAVPQTARVSTSNIEAYTLYLKGWALLDDRLVSGAAPLLEALESFRAAARLDPNFVNAYVGIASASFLLPSYDEGADREEWLERAEASARYALDLNPDSAEAFGVLAAVVSWRGDPLRAAGLFDLAIDMGNRDSNILHWNAMLATSMGYFDNTIPGLSEAYRLDPLNQLLGCSLAGSLNFSGQPEQALVVLDGMSSFSRRDLGAAVAHIYLGDWEKARELLRGIELRMGNLPDRFADLLVEAFETPLRRDTVEAEFIDGVNRGEIPVMVAFEALLLMGSPRAFDLEPELKGTYFEHRLPEAVWHNWGVELRQDPRFKGWVRALGYDQHWRKYGWPDRCRPTGLNDFECV